MHFSSIVVRQISIERVHGTMCNMLKLNSLYELRGWAFRVSEQELPALPSHLHHLHDEQLRPTFLHSLCYHCAT